MTPEQARVKELEAQLTEREQEVQAMKLLAQTLNPMLTGHGYFAGHSAKAEDVSSSTIVLPTNVDASSILDTTVGSLPDLEARISRAEDNFLESASSRDAEARAVASEVLRALRHKAELLVVLDQLRDFKRRLESLLNSSPVSRFVLQEDMQLDAEAAEEKLREAERDEQTAASNLLQVSDHMREKQDYLSRFLPVSFLEESLGRILVLYLSAPGTLSTLATIGDFEAATAAAANSRTPGPSQAPAAPDTWSRWSPLQPIPATSTASPGNLGNALRDLAPPKELREIEVQTDESGRIYADLHRQVLEGESKRQVLEASLTAARNRATSLEAALTDAQRRLSDAEQMVGAASTRVEELETQIEAMRAEKEAVDQSAEILQEYLHDPEEQLRSKDLELQDLHRKLQSKDAELQLREAQILSLRSEVQLLKHDLDTSREEAAAPAALPDAPSDEGKASAGRLPELVQQIHTAVAQVFEANGRLDDFRRSLEDDLLSFMEQANNAQALALEVNTKGSQLKENIDLVLTELKDRSAVENPPSATSTKLAPRALGFGSPVVTGTGPAPLSSAKYEAAVSQVAESLQRSLREFEAEIRSSPKARGGPKEEVLGAGDMLAQALEDRQNALSKLREQWAAYAAKLQQSGENLRAVVQQLDHCNLVLRQKQEEERELDARLLEKYEELNEVQTALIEMAETQSPPKDAAGLGEGAATAASSRPFRTPSNVSVPTPRSLQHLPTSVALRWAGDNSSYISGSGPGTRDVSPIPGFESEPESTQGGGGASTSHRPHPSHPSHLGPRSVRFADGSKPPHPQLSLAMVEIFTQTDTSLQQDTAAEEPPSLPAPLEASVAHSELEEEALQLLPSKERRLRTLESTANAQLRQLQALQRDNLELRQQVRRLTAGGSASGAAGFDALRLDRVYEEAVAELERVEEELRSASERLLECEGRRAKAEAEAAQAEQSYEVRTRAVEDTETELKSMRAVLDEVQLECERTQAEVRKSLAKVAEAERKKGDLEAEAKGLEAAVEDLGAQIESKKRELAGVESSLAEARTSLLRLEDETAEAQRRRGEAERQLAETDGQLEGISSQISQLEGQRRELEAERDALAVQLRTVRSSLVQAEAELKAVGSARTAEEGQLAQVRATLAATTGEARELAELVEALSEQVHDLQQQRQQLTADASVEVPSESASPSAKRTLFAGPGGAPPTAAATAAATRPQDTTRSPGSISVSAVLDYSESMVQGAVPGTSVAAAESLKWAGIVEEKNKVIKALESELQAHRQRDALQGALSAASMLSSPLRPSAPPAAASTSFEQLSKSLRQGESSESSPSLGLKTQGGLDVSASHIDTEHKSQLLTEIAALQEERDAASERLERLLSEMNGASSELDRARKELARVALEEKARKEELASLLLAVESARTKLRLQAAMPKEGPSSSGSLEDGGRLLRDREVTDAALRKAEALRREEATLEQAVLRARNELESLRLRISNGTADYDALQESIADLERRRSAIEADALRDPSTAPAARPRVVANARTSLDTATDLNLASIDVGASTADPGAKEAWSKFKKGYVKKRALLEGELSRLQDERTQLAREVRRSRLALHIATLQLQKCNAVGKALRCVDSALDLSVSRAGVVRGPELILTERTASDLKPCLEWVQRQVRHLSKKAEEALDQPQDSDAAPVRLPDVETLLQDSRTALEVLGVSLPSAPALRSVPLAQGEEEERSRPIPGGVEAELQRMQRKLDKVSLLLKVKDAQISEYKRRLNG